MFCGRDVCDLSWGQGASRDCFINTYYSTWEQTLLLAFDSFDPVSESKNQDNIVCNEIMPILASPVLMLNDEHWAKHFLCSLSSYYNI